MIRSIGFESGRVRIGLADRTYRELRDADRARALAWLATREHWLREREPGVVLRSLRVQPAQRRALVTLEGEPPRALTLEGSSYDDFVTGLDAIA